MSIIGWIFSAPWQGFLGLFGMSDSQKPGRLQVEQQQTAANLAAKEEEARVMEAPDLPRGEGCNQCPAPRT